MLFMFLSRVPPLTQIYAVRDAVFYRVMLVARMPRINRGHVLYA